MWQAFRALFEFLGFIEKAIPPDEIRIERFEINKPKELKRLQEWLENKWKRDSKALLRTLELDHMKKINRQLRSLIEWGMKPQFLEVQEDGYLLFKYTQVVTIGGIDTLIEGSRRIKL